MDSPLHTRLLKRSIRRIITSSDEQDNGRITEVTDRQALQPVTIPSDSVGSKTYGSSSQMRSSKKRRHAVKHGNSAKNMGSPQGLPRDPLPAIDPVSPVQQSMTPSHSAGGEELKASADRQSVSLSHVGLPTIRSVDNSHNHRAHLPGIRMTGS